MTESVSSRVTEAFSKTPPKLPHGKGDLSEISYIGSGLYKDAYKGICTVGQETTPVVLLTLNKKWTTDGKTAGEFESDLDIMQKASGLELKRFGIKPGDTEIDEHYLQVLNQSRAKRLVPASLGTMDYEGKKYWLIERAPEEARPALRLENLQPLGRFAKSLQIISRCIDAAELYRQAGRFMTDLGSSKTDTIRYDPQTGEVKLLDPGGKDAGKVTGEMEVEQAGRLWGLLLQIGSDVLLGTTIDNAKNSFLALRNINHPKKTTDPTTEMLFQTSVALSRNWPPSAPKLQQWMYSVHTLVEAAQTGNIDAFTRGLRDLAIKTSYTVPFLEYCRDELYPQLIAKSGGVTYGQDILQHVKNALKECKEKIPWDLARARIDASFNINQAFKKQVGFKSYLDESIRALNKFWDIEQGRAPQEIKTEMVFLRHLAEWLQAVPYDVLFSHTQEFARLTQENLSVPERSNLLRKINTQLPPAYQAGGDNALVYLQSFSEMEAALGGLNQGILSDEATIALPDKIAQWRKLAREYQPEMIDEIESRLGVKLPDVQKRYELAQKESVQVKTDAAEQSRLNEELSRIIAENTRLRQALFTAKRTARIARARSARTKQTRSPRIELPETSTKEKKQVFVAQAGTLGTSASSPSETVTQVFEATAKPTTEQMMELTGTWEQDVELLLHQLRETTGFGQNDMAIYSWKTNFSSAEDAKRHINAQYKEVEKAIFRTTDPEQIKKLEADQKGLVQLLELIKTKYSTSK